MNDILKKFKNGFYKFYYFKFSDFKKFIYFEKYFRPISLIFYNNYEFRHDHWYEYYLHLINYLQSIKPRNLVDLLLADNFITKKKLFVNQTTKGYYKTNFGLYVRKFSSMNDILSVMGTILDIYGVDRSDVYFVVQVPPGYDDCAEEIDEEKLKFCQFIKSTFIHADTILELMYNAIDELNHSLKYFSNTSYNNLYKLNSLYDYDVYSRKAIDLTLNRGSKLFSEKELLLAVQWLRHARFYGGDIFNDKLIKRGEFYFDDGDKHVQITFENHPLNNESREEEEE